MTSTTTHIGPVRLASGTVHRVVVDLVQVALWTEGQADSTSDRHRRRQLRTTTLACRLAAELISDTLLIPKVVRGSDGSTPLHSLTASAHGPDPPLA
ncbi:MAG: hypothetical protein U0573_12310 [Phycisphaerales bacterium]|nr:hypothetical protein [Planctomycetota bacterium]